MWCERYGMWCNDALQYDYMECTGKCRKCKDCNKNKEQDQL
jgi:hypothetical protein